MKKTKRLCDQQCLPLCKITIVVSHASNCIYILERGDVKCCLCGGIKTVGENSCIVMIWLNRDIVHTTRLENLMKNLLD